METQRKMSGAIYLSLLAVEFVKVCRYKTFWIRIFGRRTFLLPRAETAVCTAVSPMSGSPTFDIDKKKFGANLRLRHALRAGRVIKVNANIKLYFGVNTFKYVSLQKEMDHGIPHLSEYFP